MSKKLTYQKKKNAVRTWRNTFVVPEGFWGGTAYLGTPGDISCDDLNSICEELNAEWELQDSANRIGWNMGEFIPGSVRQRELLP